MRRQKKIIKKRLLSVPKNQVVSRNVRIVRKMLGTNYYVHCGNSYISVAAVPLRLGTKFGEYCPTRSRQQSRRKRSVNK